MKFHRLIWALRASSGRFFRLTKHHKPITKAASTDTTPSHWPHLSARRPSTSRIAALASGIATSSHITERMPCAEPYVTVAAE